MVSQVRVSHTRMVSSSDADSSNRPASASARLLTGPVCPVNRSMARPSLSDTRYSMPSFSALTTQVSPSGSTTRLCRPPSGSGTVKDSLSRGAGAEPILINATRALSRPRAGRDIRRTA